MTTKGICAGLGVILCFAVGGGEAADSLTLEDCAPSYEDAEGTFKDLKITVSNSAPKSLPDGFVDSASSPQGTATLTTYRFDSMKHGAGLIVVAATPRGGKPIFLSFESAKQVDAKWMNERLLYINAWWGRIVASEIVFDALEGRFLYRKLANYGFMVSAECSALHSD